MNTTKLLSYYALPNPDANSTSSCPTPSEILLYLNLFLLFSVIASLTLGSNAIRHHLSFFTSPHSILPWLSLFGSLAIHLSATVLAAYFLSVSAAGSHLSESYSKSTSHRPPPLLGRMILLLLSRPLATFPIIWLTIADPRSYLANTSQVVMVDAIYELGNVYLFGSIARLTWTFDPVGIPIAARMARGGAAVWLSTLVMTLALGVMATCGWYDRLAIRVDKGAQLWKSSLSNHPRREEEGTDDQESIGASEEGMERLKDHLVTLIPVFFNVLRFVGSWLLWAGLLYTDDKRAFCPSEKAWTRVTVVYLCAPFLDCIWRGFVTVSANAGKEGREEAETVVARNLLLGLDAILSLICAILSLICATLSSIGGTLSSIAAKC